MSEVSNGFAKALEDVTVILLETAGENYRDRASAYYQGKVKHLRVVTADIAADPVSRPENTQRARGWKRAIETCLQGVQTPYVILVPDTDFLYIDALVESVSFLGANSEIALCQGYALGYRPANASVAFHKVGNMAPDLLEPIGALQRIRQHALSRLEAWRGVVRVDALAAVVSAAPEELVLDSWKAALSFGLLAEHTATILPVVSVLVELPSSSATEEAADTGLAQLIQALRRWDGEQWQLCKGIEDLQVVGDFARAMISSGNQELLFVSTWTEADWGAERVFEPRQFIEMPYYGRHVFEWLSDVEFLVHSCPAGSTQIAALEGGWVRQRELLEVHPNDTKGSMQYRYVQALALGMFNIRVIERLLEVIEGAEYCEFKEQLEMWHRRLLAARAADCAELLSGTSSGKILQALDHAVPKGAQRESVVRYLEQNPAPALTFLVVDREEDNDALQSTFDSLLSSGLNSFKIVVLRAGGLPAITTVNDTVHFVKIAKNNVVLHLNRAVDQLKSDWFMVLDAGDVLAPGGLLRLHTELSGASECHAISASEVQRDKQGRLHSVVRPASNIDLLRNRPDLMSRHWVLRRGVVQALGGFAEKYQDAFEFDLLLRLIEEQGLSGIAHMDEYLVIADQDNGSMKKSAHETLKRHLAALGYRGEVGQLKDEGFRVDFRHAHMPLVSLLLPAGDDVDSLKSCLASITQRTRYQRYEIVIVGDVRTPEAIREYLSRFESGNGRVKVIWSGHAVAREGLLTLASSAAKGEYLVLLSSRSQVVTPAWIEVMLNQALRPEVGVVGCKMYGDDGAITHAGFELHSSGRVSSPWVGLPRLATYPALGVSVERGCHGVSSDCMMVRKDAFEQVGGIESIEQNQVFADVDLCLKVGAAGLITVWTPLAEVRVAGVLGDMEYDAEALLSRWPGAFFCRATVEACHGIDISRPSREGKLTWVAELGVVCA